MIRVINWNKTKDGVRSAKDRIVELAASRIPADSRMKTESFSTTVQVDLEILTNRGNEAFKVHGITTDEISQGPTFDEVWGRFLKWIDDIKNIFTKDSKDKNRLPVIVEDPIVVLIAHKGFRFDFPLLLCEIIRNDCSTNCFDRLCVWLHA